MRVERRDALLLPGAANALTARIIEDLGFEAVYLTTPIWACRIWV